MSTFSGKKVLVTGGAKGIGKLLGLMALEDGADCLVVWDVDMDAMRDMKEQCSQNNYKCHTYRVNLLETDRIEHHAQQVKEDVGTIDILFNNAGIVTGKPFVNQSFRDIHNTLAVNVEAVMVTANAFLGEMIKQGNGHIINISSASSLMGNPNMSVYAGSKWAVTGWSESLRLEMEGSQTGVKVTTVQPSYVNTGMFEGVKAPLLTPLLKPETIARKIIGAVKKDKILLREPFIVKITPFLKGVLPARIFDLVAGRLFRVYESMNTFRGRQPND